MFLGQAIDLALILGIHSQREKPELFCWITVAIEAGMAGHEVEQLIEWEVKPLERSEKDALAAFATLLANPFLRLGLLSPPTCKEYTTVMRNRLRMPESSSATDRSHWQTIETQLFVSDCFRKLPRLLAKEPIKVPSGKYEETLRVERTQQDLINEMAMELSSLPRFTANAKVIEERDKTQLVHKQQIQTLPMPPVQQSIATIEPRLLAASHQLCKERDAIEDEIRQRQDRWRNRQPPPRQPPPSEEPPTEITA